MGSQGEVCFFLARPEMARMPFDRLNIEHMELDMARFHPTRASQVYFCGRSEQRMLRLAGSHCQQALEQLLDVDQQLLAKLLNAKVARLKRGPGGA